MPSNSHECMTRLIVTALGHYNAAWVWSCRNFVHSAHTAHKMPPWCGEEWREWEWVDCRTCIAKDMCCYKRCNPKKKLN